MFPLRLYVFLQVIQIMVALTVMVFGVLRATWSKGVVSDCMVYIWRPVMVSQLTLLPLHIVSLINHCSLF